MEPDPLGQLLLSQGKRPITRETHPGGARPRRRVAAGIAQPLRFLGERFQAGEGIRIDDLQKHGRPPSVDSGSPAAAAQRLNLLMTVAASCPGIGVAMVPWFSAASR